MVVGLSCALAPGRCPLGSVLMRWLTWSRQAVFSSRCTASCWDAVAASERAPAQGRQMFGSLQASVRVAEAGLTCSATHAASLAGPV